MNYKSRHPKNKNLQNPVWLLVACFPIVSSVSNPQLIIVHYVNFTFAGISWRRVLAVLEAYVLEWIWIASRQGSYGTKPLLWCLAKEWSWFLSRKCNSNVIATHCLRWWFVILNIAFCIANASIVLILKVGAGCTHFCSFCC